MLQGWGSDLRWVWRVLRRSPAFTAIAVLSLALGIGANTAMLGVVRSLLLEPLPVGQPQELRLVGWEHPGDLTISQIGSADYPDARTGRVYRSNLSYPLYRALRDAAPAEAGLFAFAFLRGVSIGMPDGPALHAGGALVDGRYFSGLRVPMALGRGLDDTDDRPDASLAVVLSHAFWMRAFGGDSTVVGRTVRINSRPAEVVGVSAAGFVGLSPGGFFPQTEITLPLAAQPVVYPRMWSDGSLFSAEDVFWLRVMARISPGGADTALRAALERALRTVSSPLTAQPGQQPELALLSGARGAQPIRPETARLLWLMLGVVGIVLLIACVNLAGLMLARGVRRQGELVVRRALGGERHRLVRQMLLESLVLGLAGTIAGVAAAVGARDPIRWLVTGSLGAGAPAGADTQVLDPGVLAGSALLGLGSTVLFGLLPALRVADVDGLTGARARVVGSSTPRLTVGRVLIALQVAVSVPLVVGAALLLRTVSNLGRVELGFEPAGLVAFQIDPGFVLRSEADYPALYVRLLERVRAVPGVRSVTLLENALLSGIASNGPATVDGERHMVYRNAVGPAYLETLGVPLVAGRVPGVQDGPDAPPVAAVNETAARALFAGASPLGRTIRVGGRDVQVVGVVGDTPYRSQRDAVPPTLHESALQRNGYGGHTLVLRTDVPVATLEPRLRDAVAQVHPDLPVPALRTQGDLMAQTSAKERVFTRLLALFGGFALLLASIGLHGVTSYAVSRRTREIGVRVAVGARPSQILWMILRQVLGLAGAGLLVGLPLAWATSPWVGSLLYGVGPADPVALGTSGLALLLVALSAGLLPALRAARLDPMQTLRAD